MNTVATFATFVVYFIFLLAVGGYFYRKTGDVEDYLLGGRNMGRWVTALSAQASDMSGWLLMGLPGALYLSGMSQAWIAIGLALGTWCNWLLVAPRLRIYTEKTEALTLATFFGQRFGDPYGVLRLLTAVITLLFFTFYASAGLVGAGKLFESLFALDYRWAVIIGAVIMVAYTFLGGYMAVCWTDLFQGALMFLAITLVPIMAYHEIGGWTSLSQAVVARELSLNLLIDNHQAIGLVTVISAMAWGLGYFGQPHILIRFMGIRSAGELPRTTTIAMVWVVISLLGAMAVGIIAIALFPQLADGEQEKVFIFMIGQLFNPWLGGVLLAAILAAIMSTIDSQLLVSSSTLTEDFYKFLLRKQADDQELMWVGRFCVLVIAAVAMWLALSPDNTVLGLVAYAWGGFGAAFGPVVLAALFLPRTRWQGALTGMVLGTLVLVVWKQLGYGTTLYEIVPGFAANALTLLAFNVLWPCRDERVEQQFSDMRRELRG